MQSKKVFSKPENNQILGLLLSILLVYGCQSHPSYQKMEGRTMGTLYHITCLTNHDPEKLKEEIDVRLISINNEVSTYQEDAKISLFNKSYSEILLEKDGDFASVLLKAQEIYRLTNGAFDPTVMPLVNYWGFGYEQQRSLTAIDSFKVDSILQYVGMDKLTITDQGDQVSIVKSKAEVELDFSSIAKGYAVDVIGELLQMKGIEDYMVEIGGEAIVKGKNPKGAKWTLGINKPDEGASIYEFINTVSISDGALATSGNYRNYYEVDGTKISHTINPRGGFPERTQLLQASIISDNCMTSDALSTSCMVLGLDKSWNLINSMRDIEGSFVYVDINGKLQTKSTDGFLKYINH